MLSTVSARIWTVVGKSSLDNNIKVDSLLQKLIFLLVYNIPRLSAL